MADEFTSHESMNPSPNPTTPNEPDPGNAPPEAWTGADVPEDQAADVRDLALAGAELTPEQAAELNFGERMATGNLTADDDVARAAGRQGGDLTEQELGEQLKAESEALRARNEQKIADQIKAAGGEITP